ncbi:MULTISPECIES: ModD protein [Thiorhodovibrio]|uniref:ModD protein n=1 Tax=Thiorhodovibrio TaxID=61593 RepID=UPI0019115D8E|nr:MULTISPECIES: ModD protein [Thiorhodovibrio]MBK5967601.1 ModD protein [Thiorhodovibrio winogradskyi]WPL14952.1 Nicotinate-nucleotide pyrophosphorylase [carboxylating] [Thiorhodovibrio litoralis]
MTTLSTSLEARPALGDAALHRLIEEDVPYGDLTTESLGISRASGCIRFFVRDAMRVCGTEEAARMFELCGARASLKVPSGEDGAPGTLLLDAQGSAGALHRVWKSAQTLVEWCSGVASSAAEITVAARSGHPDALVAGTRKNVPGNRRLAAKAFVAGGAVMHRLGLSETLLVFAEHREFLGASNPARTLKHLRQRCPEKRVVVEVSSLDEALAWSDADVLQLEKFAPELVAQTLAALRDRQSPALVAAAGGINARNAAEYARAGAHLLITTAPHLAPPRDVQVRFEAL